MTGVQTCALPICGRRRVVHLSGLRRIVHLRSRRRVVHLSGLRRIVHLRGRRRVVDLSGLRRIGHLGGRRMVVRLSGLRWIVHLCGLRRIGRICTSWWRAKKSCKVGKNIIKFPFVFIRLHVLTTLFRILYRAPDNVLHLLQKQTLVCVYTHAFIIFIFYLMCYWRWSRSRRAMKLHKILLGICNNRHRHTLATCSWLTLLPHIIWVIHRQFSRQ